MGKNPKLIKETLEVYKEITFGLAETPVMSDSLFIPSLKGTVLFGKAFFFGVDVKTSTWMPVHILLFSSFLACFH